jgi:hypothetical protein
MRNLQTVSLAIVMAFIVVPAFAGAPGNAPATLAPGNHTPASVVATLSPMSWGVSPWLSQSTSSCDPLCRQVAGTSCSPLWASMYCSTGSWLCQAAEEYICYCENPGPKWHCTP